MAARSRRRRPAIRWVKSRAVVMVPVSRAIPGARQTHASAPGRENASRDAARGPSAASVEGGQRSAARAVLPAAALSATGDRENQRQAVAAAKRGAAFVGGHSPSVHRTSSPTLRRQRRRQWPTATSVPSHVHGHVRRSAAASAFPPRVSAPPRVLRPATVRPETVRPETLQPGTVRPATVRPAPQRHAPRGLASPRHPRGATRKPILPGRYPRTETAPGAPLRRCSTPQPHRSSLAQDGAGDLRPHTASREPATRNTRTRNPRNPAPQPPKPSHPQHRERYPPPPRSPSSSCQRAYSRSTSRPTCSSSSRIAATPAPAFW